jgi:exodeoxyribonuclease V alpha subunit
MTDNPYRLARDIRGIGFKTADAIAMKLGIEKSAMVRVRAGISYALTEAMDEGHCGLPTDELMPLAEKLLEVTQQLIRTALELELQEGTVMADQVAETPCVFLAGLYRAERTIAQGLRRLANGTLPWPWIDPDKALPWVEKHVGFALAESQIAAIRLALISKVLVMTGGPGVGKTTIVKAILRILAAKGTSLLLCAPTGRAAKRMTEATGFEAKTIHRLPKCRINIVNRNDSLPGRASLTCSGPATSRAKAEEFSVPSEAARSQSSPPRTLCTRGET